MKKINFLFICFILLSAFSFANTTDGLPVSADAKIKAKQKLQAIKDRISKGEDFNKLAMLYSEDPGSASKGSCYDSIKRGALVPQFEAVAFELKVNEVSDIFETRYGYHLVLLRAKRADEVDVCHILIIPK